MVLNGEGMGRHPLSGALYCDLDAVSSEQGSGRRFLSGTLHRRPGVVTNVQGSSHRSCWGLVLKCYELRTRQHKMLKVNALRPSKHYLP
jgi:hypothetical protein